MFCAEAKLQRAADYFLPSSSESDEGSESSDEGAEASARKPSMQNEGTAHKAEHHDRKKRKRHKYVHYPPHALLCLSWKSLQVLKWHACREKKERSRAKRPKSDAEKIVDLERREAAAGKLTREAAKKHWASGEQHVASYIDTHGDRDNVAFDGLYRANVAAYSRLDPTGVAKGTRPRYGYVYGPRCALHH